MKWAHAMAVLFAATTMGAWAEADSKTRESVDDATAVYSDAILSRGDPNILRRAFDKAERGETLHVAVIGGSITEGAAAGAPGRNWGALFVSGWRKLFPKTKVEFLNAGVGATGSLVGAFRYSQHVSPFRPDVLAIEFSANDADGDEARQTMEGLIRHALREGTAVVLLGMTQQNGTSVNNDTTIYISNDTASSKSNFITFFIKDENSFGFEPEQFFFRFRTGRVPIFADAKGNRDYTLAYPTNNLTDTLNIIESGVIYTNGAENHKYWIVRKIFSNSPTADSNNSGDENE